MTFPESHREDANRCCSGKGVDVETREEQPRNKGAALEQVLVSPQGMQITIFELFCRTFFVQSLSSVRPFVTPWTAACQASLSFTISWSLHRLMSIELVMPSNHLVLCHNLLLLPSVFPSITVFSNESALCITWPKYWSFSIRPSSKGLTSLISLQSKGPSRAFSRTMI